MRSPKTGKLCVSRIIQIALLRITMSQDLVSNSWLPVQNENAGPLVKRAEKRITKGTNKINLLQSVF